MREMEWPPRLPLAGLVVDLHDLRITPCSPGGATLISGDLDAGIEALTGEASRVGLGGVAGDPPFVLVIARDRGCLISQAPLNVESGWDARGFAATPADDAWLFFTISGPAQRRSSPKDAPPLSAPDHPRPRRFLQANRRS